MNGPPERAAMLFVNPITALVLIREVLRVPRGGWVLVMATPGRGVAYALGCVGGELAGKVVRCLGLDGRLVIYGTLRAAREFTIEGVFHTVIAAVFPLDEVAAAVSAALAPARTRKVVLHIGSH